jgi:hypothetical protein
MSEVFLKFAEIFFTNGKADPLHKPKFKTCLIRIPGTCNSKLLNKGFGKEESLVKIIQKWNGNRIPIQYLLKELRRWLFQEDFNQRSDDKKGKYFGNSYRCYKTILWIENLLETPLKDHRKYCIFHILVPYLVNVKELSVEEASHVIENWLSKCNSARPLDFDPSTEAKSRIKYVKDYKPMRLSKLETDNMNLYRLLNTKFN